MSTVFFAGPEGVEQAIPKLIEASGFLQFLNPRKKLGVKLHFGEEGNQNYLSPSCVRVAIQTVSRRVTECALIETSTLYRGERATAAAHLKLAHRHGFTMQSVMAPAEIVDGKQGEAYYEVPVNLRFVKRARLAKGLKHIHSLLNMAHFKGHFVTGFGGVLKNLGMGLAAKGGKLEMHSSSHPFVKEDKCTGCGVCVEYCPNRAIDLVHKVARIGRSCSGCAECTIVCEQGAISIDWDEASENVSMKVVEYAAAVLKDPVDKQKRTALHMNFAIRITPNCDCMGTTEKPMMSDVGVFASLDPVGCEQAAYDRTKDELEKLYPHLTPQKAIDYAEELGLGSRHYKLEEVH